MGRWGGVTARRHRSLPVENETGRPAVRMERREEDVEEEEDGT